MTKLQEVVNLNTNKTTANRQLRINDARQSVSAPAPPHRGMIAS